MTPASINERTSVYLFPGIGSDSRIFEKIVLNRKFQINQINYFMPSRGQSMEQYAISLREQIISPANSVLIGVSIGGMFCVELHDIIKPAVTIIISSAKCRKELPLRYRFQKYLPLNRLVPCWLTKAGTQLLQPLVEPDRNKNKETFKTMIKDKDGCFLKATVDMVINWKRTIAPANVFHIHGDNDHTLPLKNIKSTQIIPRGSHMMTLTRGEEINKVILSILESDARAVL